MIHELGEQEARAILAREQTGRLGCCLNNEPYVVPVHYWYDGADAFVHSLPGRKVDILRANPHACLQVDEVQDTYHWRSVIGFGHYQEITDATERERVLTELFKRLPHLTPVESCITKDVTQALVFRLRFHRVTGVYEDWH